MMKLTSITGLLSLSAVLLSSHLPAAAQNCRPLSLLGGEGSEVTKSVSQPTVPGPFGVTITRNNWNTDWAVPGGRRFQRFIVTVSVPRGCLLQYPAVSQV